MHAYAYTQNMHTSIYIHTFTHMYIHMHVYINPSSIICNSERVKKASVSTNKDLGSHTEIIGDKKCHLVPRPSGTPALLLSNY